MSDTRMRRVVLVIGAALSGVTGAPVLPRPVHFVLKTQKRESFNDCE